MSAFIKDFIERGKINRRNFLFDLAAGLTGAAMPGVFGRGAAVADAGGCISTIWNKTDDLHPWDIGDNYVAHLSWSGEKPSEEAARMLFEKMGGKGGVVQLCGIPANIPAIERLNGLKNALKDFPNIELLDAQPADWDTTKAAELMASYLTRHGDKIKGVHCANDNMAYGVIEALNAAGIADMPITAFDGNPEAVDLVMQGDLLATVFTNPHWGGGIALALAHQAAIGAFKPSEEPNAHSEFYGPSIQVTPADAAEFKAKHLDSTPTYDWNGRWGLSADGIAYK
jgi:ribose transport system substrate-binding protein